MDHKFAYYIAGGKSLDAAREVQAGLKVAAVEIEQIKAEFGAKGVMRMSTRISGLVFDADAAPAGWRKDYGAGTRFYAPYRKTKADKAIWAKFHAVKIPDASTFSALIGMGGGIMTGPGSSGHGFTISYAFYEMLSDGRMVITIPLPEAGSEAAPFVPPDCVPLKVSEYFALKEAEPAKDLAA